MFPEAPSVGIGVTEGDDEDVSLPVTVVPLEPDGDEPGEADPLSGEGAGESLVVGEVTGEGDGLVAGAGVGVGLGSGSDVGSGERRTLNTVGALVALTL